MVARLRQLVAYGWAAPTTAVGALVAGAVLLTGGRARVIDGVIEVAGGVGATLLRRAPIGPGGAAAITFGHIIIGVDEPTLATVRAHEHVHVRQTERWGPLFLPAYLASSLLALVRRRNPYLDNRFEREAYRIDRDR